MQILVRSLSIGGTQYHSSCQTIHALTGCDTTLFFYRVGKLPILKKLFKNPEQCTLLSGLDHDEALDVGTIENVKEFIRTVVYNGKATETYIETRVRMYSLKSKDLFVHFAWYRSCSSGYQEDALRSFEMVPE